MGSLNLDQNDMEIVQLKCLFDNVTNECHCLKVKSRIGLELQKMKFKIFWGTENDALKENYEGKILWHEDLKKNRKNCDIQFFDLDQRQRCWNVIFKDYLDKSYPLC